MKKGNILNVKLAGFIALGFFFMQAVSFKVNAQLVCNATFTFNPTTMCAPVTVTCTDQTSGGPTGWSWQVTGPGYNQTYTQQNPSFSLTTAGSYTVTLTAYKSSGGYCTKTYPNAFTVKSAPVANISVDPSSKTVCFGEPFEFTDISTLSGGNITSRNWDFGDGLPLPNGPVTVSHTYASVGTFPVSLVVKGSNGCESSTTVNVTVLPKPDASFTADDLMACSAPHTVQFDNVQSGAQYNWDFGNGTGTQNDPTRTYGLGTYTVTLIVSMGQCKDTVTKPNYIIVQGYDADFIGDDLEICLKDSVHFSESPNPVATSVIWYFTNSSSGTQDTSYDADPWYTFPSPGDYTITMIGTNAAGCPDTVTKPNYIHVNDNPKANFVTDTTKSCRPPLPVNFTNTSTIGASSGAINFYYWNFGDPSSGAANNTSSIANPSHTYNNYGSYSDTLVVRTDKGCADTTVKFGYILIQRPVANLGADILQGCAPLSCNFSDASTCATDSIVAWEWDFGDPSGFGAPDTSTLQNPSWTYINAPQKYDVQLIITTLAGCMDTVMRDDYIKTGLQPNADFILTSADSQCYGAKVMYEFENLTPVFPAAGGADSLTWTFADDHENEEPIAEYLTQANQTAQHIMGKSGVVMVTLIATNNGCPDTVIKSIFVKPPKAEVYFEGIDPEDEDWPCRDESQNIDTDPYTLNFSIPADSGSDYTSFIWNFGDGTIRTDSSELKHTFPATGPYTITLTLFNANNGCSDSAKKNVIITDVQANFTIDPLMECYPYVVSFTNTSVDFDTLTANVTNPDVFVSTCFWTFDPLMTWSSSPQSSISGTDIGDIFAITPPNDTIEESGDFEVMLTVKDIHGCTSEITKLVKARGATPDFDMDDNEGCTPLTVEFTDESEENPNGFSPNIPIVLWEWQFPGGIPDSFTTAIAGQNPPPVVYNTPGTYPVTLTVTTATTPFLPNGCKNKVTYYVYPTFPYPAIDMDSLGCKLTDITFDASPTVTTPNAVYAWDFGDSSTGTGRTVTHQYAADGTYPIKLTVTDDNNCDSTIYDTIVIQKPVADFVIDDSIDCGVTYVNFIDATQGLSISSWNWNFGDSATSILQNPSHNYTMPGTYDIQLIVSNSAGCMDTVKFNDSVAVYGPAGTYSFTPDPAIHCNPFTVTFCATSNNSTSYIWDFGNGVVWDTTAACVTYTYVSNQDVTYTPVLLMANTLPNGEPCQLAAPSAGNVTITTPQTVEITPDPLTLAEGETGTFSSTLTNVDLNNVTYSWTPTGETTSSVDVTGNGSGSTETYILAINDTGCVAYDTAEVVHLLCVSDLYMIPNVFTPNHDNYNEVFLIDKGFCDRSVYELKVFDRWGKEVFATTDRTNSWNGKMQNAGATMPDGVYYYVIIVDGKKYEGFVHLVR